jgi:hypothetical protein
MTDQEVLAAIGLIGRDRAAGQLARLRRSDLESIAHERGVRVDVSRAESSADLARRVVLVVASRAERGAKRSRSRR